MEIKELKVGDDITIMITGMIGDYRARVVEIVDGWPQLKVLTPDGAEDQSWPMRLKMGDFILRESQ